MIVKLSGNLRLHTQSGNTKSVSEFKLPQNKAVELPPLLAEALAQFLPTCLVEPETAPGGDFTVQNVTDKHSEQLDQIANGADLEETENDGTLN